MHGAQTTECPSIKAICPRRARISPNEDRSVIYFSSSTKGRLGSKVSQASQAV
jgi:hypothetical protein